VSPEAGTARTPGAAVASRRRRGRPRRDERPADGPSTEQLILRAAAEAFAARGYDGASMAEIASSAGLSTGAVYTYFRGKPELLLRVVSATLEAVTRRLRASHASTPAVLHDWVAWLIAPEQAPLRALIAEIQHAALRDNEVRQLLAGYGEEYTVVVASSIERWQADGMLVADRAPLVVAELFLTQALGLCSTSSFQPDLLRSRRFRRLLDEQLGMLLGEAPG
jgi:AcrR family transcriptional regulator